MPTFTVHVTVEVWADTARDAYGYIKHALDNAKKQEVIYLDAEIVETKADEDDELCRAGVESWRGQR